MVMIWKVESTRGPVVLSHSLLVPVLVALAVATSFQAAHRISEIQREMAFRETLTRSLDELSAATDAIAAARPAP